MPPSKGGLPESVKQGFKFNRPAAPAVATESTPPATDEVSVEQNPAVSTVSEVFTAKTSLHQIPPKSIKGKGGRPRGETKIKKTVYLASGAENLQKSRLKLAKQADLIFDESQLTDLALALLKTTLDEPDGILQVLAVIDQMNKGQV